MEIAYKEFINDILNTRGRFACGDEYHERHHIIPKCMDGGNNKENLIDLFAREHFEAHRLLALENPSNKLLQYAWWNMAHCKGNDEQYRCIVSPEEYEEAKIAFSKANSGVGNPRYGKKASPETRRKISKSLSGKFVGDKNPMYGKRHSEETRIKISQNINITEETRRLWSEQRKGRVMSEEQRQKISNKLKGTRTGKDNPNYINCIPIIQLTKDGKFIAEYESSEEAHKCTGIDSSAIRKVCNKVPKYRTAGGYKWINKDEYDKMIEVEINSNGQM